MWPDVVCVPLFMLLAHLKTPHISRAFGEISSTRKNLSRISRYSAPLCSVNPWWSFQVVHKLAHNNSRLHRNYILLTACSFTCVFLLCVFTMHEPDLSHPSAHQAFGWRESFVSVWLAVHLSVAWDHSLMKMCIRSRLKVDPSQGWFSPSWDRDRRKLALPFMCV